MALIPGLALAATVPPSGEPHGIRLSISATTERIPLPGLRGPVELTVDAMARRLRLRLSKKDTAAGLAARIAAHVGMLCPRVETKDDTVELGCRSRRIEAQITAEGKLSYLDINELRGLPWRAGPDAAPSYFYDPWRIGLQQSCPGRTDGAQGECELKDGHILPAAIHFRAALETTQRQLACVRLGDLAVSIGDPITASGWYRRAGSFGNFGRIAEGRLCELDGHCLDTTQHVLRAFDSAEMPEPLRAESLLRAARAEAYSGRLPSAMHIISRQAREHGMTSVCREGGDLLCRRILLEAMRAAGTLNPVAAKVAADATAARGAAAVAKTLDKTEHEYLEELLETYLALPSWEKGPFAVELSQAAAPLASRLGAPGFGGALLASLAPEVPDAQLSNHLLLATETFLGGQNWARARIVAEYAQSRLANKNKDKRGGKAAGAGEGLNSPRWVAVLRALKERAEEEEVSPEVRAAIDTEVGATMTELKNARAVMDKAESVLGTARAAARAASEAESKARARAAETRGPTSSSPLPSSSSASRPSSLSSSSSPSSSSTAKGSRPSTQAPVAAAKGEERSP